MSQNTPTKDMNYVHNVFRDAFARAEILESIDIHNASQVKHTALYFSSIFTFLHAHHHTEDTYLWPPLLERAPEKADIINHGIEQHEALADALPNAQKATDNFAMNPSTESLKKLADAALGVASVLVDHLKDEENNVLPICSEHITMEEWQSLAPHTLSALEGPTLMMVLGLVYDAFDDDYKAAMAKLMPDELKNAWVNEGQKLYQNTMKEMNISLH